MTTHDLIEPAKIDGKVYTKLEVKPFGFVDYANASFDVQAYTTNKSIQARFRRIAVKLSGTLVSQDGQLKLALDDKTIGLLPIMAAQQIISICDRWINDAINSDVKPEILVKGDGITTPILLKLADPIEFGGKTISELEFSAKNFDDAEEVVARSGTLYYQTAALLEDVGRPVGMLSMPEFVLKRISMKDGMAIADEVLPSFLYSPKDSQPSLPDTNPPAETA